MLFILILFSCTVHAQDPGKADSLYQAGNWKDASTLYSALVKKEPQTGQYQFRLGRCKVKLNDYNGAILHLRKAVSIGNNPVVMLNLADAFALKNMTDSSLAWLEKSINAGLPQYGLLKASETARVYAENERFKKIAAGARKVFEPCTAIPEARQFDFWIGEWTVFNASNNAFSGTSSVQLILGSCVIFENWTDGYGGEGKSFNVYDTLAKQWIQIWVDDKAHQTIYKGGMKNGSMIVTTDNMKQPGGSFQVRRMTFTPNADGSVRQFGEASNDEGKTWFTQFDLVYKKKTS